MLTSVIQKKAMPVRFMVLASGLLSACSVPHEPPPAAITRVVFMTVGEAEEGALRQLTANIEASQRAELSFRVAGKLQEITISEGDSVTEGQVLARLVQHDFRTALVDREAAYRRAAADYSRAGQLIDDGYITRREYDQLKSRYRQTRAQWEQAKLELSYTTLSAPFDGVVARRFVEKHEEITLGRPIFSLRSSDMVDVKINVPESLMILAEADAERSSEDRVVVTASFSARPDLHYPLTFKEIAHAADRETRTFEVTYMMPQPEEINVLPGMTASVTVVLPNLQGAIYRVPVRAVIGNIAMEPRVWVLDEQSMTVSSRPVKVGRMQGGDIEIMEGLDVGDKLVTSPSNFLLEGQKVEITPSRESSPLEQKSA